MRMKRACGVLALGLIAGSVSSAFSSRKDQPQQSSKYKGCDSIRYKIKKKKDKIKVTFRANPSVDEKEPVVLTGAVVHLAFEDVQKSMAIQRLPLRSNTRRAKGGLIRLNPELFQGCAR